MFSPEERARIEKTAAYQWICARPEWVLEALKLAAKAPFLPLATEAHKALDEQFLRSLHISPE